MKNPKKKVFVGVSGGVDSAVSLYLLKKEGYDVTGVFIRTWSPDFIDCTWRDERRDAMRICAELGVRFLECDAEEAYKKGVADYMIKEYSLGRTPNPDVMCNREVKFGVFWDFAKAHGADAVATGHYARISQKSEARNQNNEFQLLRGKDESKDQSYFLWTLTKDDLAHTLFPVGELEKKEVRRIADKIGLSNAKKKDSQGVCFLGPIDLKEFLSHYIKTQKGDVLSEDGSVIGFHDGAVFFTLGERHGFTITKKTSEDAPYYVVGKDVEKNTITVSHEIEKIDEKSDKKIILKNVVLREEISEEKVYDCEIRYHGKKNPCFVKKTNKDLEVCPKDGGIFVAPGQSVVIYDGDVCVGGGIVC